MSKRNYIQANKDWLEAKAKALDDAEYYENLRAKREEQAAYDDFIASLDMNDSRVYAVIYIQSDEDYSCGYGSVLRGCRAAR